MYSRQYFTNEFRHVHTDELLERYATQDLTQAAKDAIQLVLRERGIADEKLSVLAIQVKKESFRRNSSTNECD